MAIGRSRSGKPKMKSCDACGAKYEDGTARVHGMEFDSLDYVGKDGFLRPIHDGEAIGNRWANRLVQFMNLVASTKVRR